MISDQTYVSLIGEIYEATLDPVRWRRVIEQICQATHSRSGAIFIQDKDVETINGLYAHGLPALANMLYSGGIDSPGSGLEILASEPAGAARTFINPDEPGFPHSVYFEQVLRPTGIYYVAGLNIVNDEHWHVGLGLHRYKEQGLFEDEVLALLTRLAPHMARALRIQKEFTRLRIRVQELSASLSHLITGVIVVNEKAEPIYLNPVARAMLAYHPALFLQGNRLGTSDSLHSDRLHHAIVDMITQGDADPPDAIRAIGLHDKSDDSSLIAVLSHYRLSDPVCPQREEARVVIYLSDPDASLPISPDTLEQVYGLTDAEAKVAICLANGLEMDAIAEVNGISVNTVRTQVKRVYAKTGVKRQAELVRLLLSGVFTLRV